jgi:hypothetical protein
MKQNRQTERRGSALVASLFVVMAVSALSIAFLQLSLSKSREGRSSVDAKRAFYMAEAGLSEAFTAIRMGRSGNVGTEEEPAKFATGVFWVVAEEQEDQTCLLTSTGLCGTGRASLSVIVDKTESSVPALGVFGDDDVVIEEGALIDSYDSRLGEYNSQGFDPDWYQARIDAIEAAQEVEAGGLSEGGGLGGGGLMIGHAVFEANDPESVWGAAVGSSLGGPTQLLELGGAGGMGGMLEVTTTEDAADNDYDLDEWADVIHEMEDTYRLPRSSKITGNADITILGTPEGTRPTRVLGSLRPGPEGTVTTESGTLVSGTTTPGEERILLPVIELPDIADSGDRLLRGPVVLADGEFGYGTLQAPIGTTLVLRGPLTLKVEDFVIEAGAELRIDTTNGPVEVYATEYFGLEDNSQVVSVTKTPAEAVFIVTSDSWIDRDGDGEDDSPAVLEATGAMHSVFYAPHADLKIDSDLRYFGSVAGRKLTVGTNAKVHFDLALEDVAGGPLSIPKLVAWRMEELPDAPIVRQRLDPILWLKAQGVTPPEGELAYHDDMLVIRFTCVDGHTHNYSGPKHLFKRRYVASVLSELKTAAPGGRLDPPDGDYMDPAFGHAAQEANSPFVTVP